MVYSLHRNIVQLLMLSAIILRPCSHRGIVDGFLLLDFSQLCTVTGNSFSCSHLVHL